MELVLTRRQAVELFAAALAIGVVGGLTSTEEGRKPDEEPHEGGEEPP